MQYLEVEITQMTQIVWDSVLGLEMERDAGQDEGKDDTADVNLSACVQITGAWEGAVTLDCGEALAKKAASAMFEVDAAEMSAEEMRDAVGELVNMIGGNIKSLLPGPSSLSPPAVAIGSELVFSLPGSQRLSRLAFSCEGLSVFVSLLEREEEKIGAED